MTAASPSPPWVTCLFNSKVYKSVMVNGDLTNDDNTGEQTNKFLEIYQHAFDMPLLLGLGNHDTYCDDCTGYSMQFYQGYLDDLKHRGEIRDVDAGQFSSSDRYGSWSFARDEGKYTFLFLQNSFGPNNGYDGEFYDRLFTDTVGLFDYNQYHFLSSESWLINQLCHARNMGQSIILLTHSAQAMTKVVANRPALEAALAAAPILAIMSGHIHKWSGKGGEIAGKQVLYTGSPFYETYIDMSFKGDGTGLSYEVFDYGKQENLQSHTIQIAAPMPTPAQCWVTPRQPPKECDTNSDCPNSRPICDNRWVEGTDRCIAKRELGGNCFYDDTCASGYCAKNVLIPGGFDGICRCQECHSSGCGGCEAGQYCVDWSIFVAHECREYRKYSNGEDCDVSSICESGCCAYTAFGTNTCEEDAWHRSCT